MMPNSLTDARELDLMPPAPADQGSSSVMKVPAAKSLSHARKMAKVLFGPLARIWVRNRVVLDGPGKTVYEVGVESGDSKKVFGIGDLLQEALQLAVQSVSEYERQHGKLPKNVNPQFSAAGKSVLTRRQKWIHEYLDAWGTFGIGDVQPLPEGDREEIKQLVSSLRPNEVKDFQPPQVGSPEAVKAYIARLCDAVGRA